VFGLGIQWTVTGLLGDGSFGRTPLWAVALPPLLWIVLILASGAANFIEFARRAHPLLVGIGCVRTIVCVAGFWLTAADLNVWMQVV
jgi:hypothetical protein